MGEAKRRGTFEERQAKGTIRRITERNTKEAERALAQAAYEASLTPEQKRKIKRAEMILAAGIGTIASMTIPPYRN